MRFNRVGVGFAAMAAMAAGQALGQCSYQQLLSSDKAGGDALGYSMAMASGGGSYTLLLGAPYDDNARGADAGAVYAFTRNNQVWYEYGKIIPPSNLASGFFGASVGLSGSEAIVGAQAAGGIYIYQRTGNVWNYAYSHLAPPSDQLGASVAMSGAVAVAGAPFHAFGGDAGSGRIAIFERDANFAWSLRQTLGQESFHREGADWMGMSVATNGTYVFAGAPRGDSGANDDCGWVMVSRKDGSQWVIDQTLFPPGAEAGQRFGASMAAEGNWLVVGAPYATVAGKADAGLAYLYYFNGGYWQHVTTIQPYPVYAGANFGGSVSIDTGRIVVGAKGTENVFVFRQDAFAEWNQLARFTDPDGGTDGFGGAVAIDAERVVVGDSGNDPSGLTNAGAGYLYHLDPDVADSCPTAVDVSEGTFAGCTTYAVLDGSSVCSGLSPSPDVYFRYVAPDTGTVTFDAAGSSFDTVLSVHDGCPATLNNEIACNDDASGFESNARVAVQIVQGAEYIVRLGGAAGERGSFVLDVSAVTPDPCYADFNHDGVLNTLDFIAFLNAWAVKDNTADFNDDGTVNTLDVIAYLNAFTAGC